MGTEKKFEIIRQKLCNGPRRYRILDDRNYIKVWKFRETSVNLT